MELFHGFGLTVMLSTMWTIWKQRCRFDFSGDLQILHRVVQEARSLSSLIAKVYATASPEIVLRWARSKAPRPGFIALNTDGSSFGNPEQSEFGGTLRSEDGSWIAGFDGHMGFFVSLQA